MQAWTEFKPVRFAMIQLLSAWRFSPVSGRPALRFGEALPKEGNSIGSAAREALREVLAVKISTGVVTGIEISSLARAVTVMVQPGKQTEVMQAVRACPDIQDGTDGGLQYKGTLGTITVRVAENHPVHHWHR